MEQARGREPRRPHGPVRRHDGTHKRGNEKRGMDHPSPVHRLPRGEEKQSVEG